MGELLRDPPLDGTAFPYVQDLDGVWHTRPSDDHWVAHDVAEAQARSLCGLDVASVHVSAYHPSENTDAIADKICSACEEARGG